MSLTFPDQSQEEPFKSHRNHSIGTKKKDTKVTTFLPVEMSSIRGFHRLIT